MNTVTVAFKLTSEF